MKRKYKITNLFSTAILATSGLVVLTSCSKAVVPQVSFGTKSTMNWMPGMTTNLTFNTVGYYYEKFNYEIDVYDEQGNKLEKDEYIMFQNSDGQNQKIDEWIKQNPISSNIFVCPSIVVISQPSQTQYKFVIKVHFYSEDHKINTYKTIDVVNSSTKIIFDSPIYDPYGVNRTEPSSYHDTIDVEDEWFDSFFGNEKRGAAETFDHFYKNHETPGTPEFLAKQLEINNMLCADFYYHVNTCAEWAKDHYFDNPPAELKLIKMIMKLDKWNEENSRLSYVYDTVKGTFENFEMKLWIDCVSPINPATKLQVILNLKFGDFDTYRLDQTKGTSEFLPGGVNTFTNGQQRYSESGEMVGYSLFPVNDKSVYVNSLFIGSNGVPLKILTANPSFEYAYWWNNALVFGNSDARMLFGLNFFSYCFKNFGSHSNSEIQENQKLKKNKVLIDTNTNLYLKNTTGQSQDYFEKYFFNFWKFDSPDGLGKYDEYKYENWIDWEKGGNIHPKETIDSIYGVGTQHDEPNADVNIEVWDGNQYTTTTRKLWQIVSYA
ncbi:MAG: hypothetical protein LBC44_04880, partial [Mycoplasmataceae bacterium]|nr:hypothetical protein [Mycoplasmataceae bacterium]